MRVAALLSIVMLSAAAAGPAVAQAESRAPDGSSTYVVPAGIQAFTDDRLKPGQAPFEVMRTIGGRKERVGICVLGVSTLAGSPNLQTWAGMIATHRTDTEAKARAKAAPGTFVSVGGYRELTLPEGGDGYFYWFEQRGADGQQQTHVVMVGLIRPQSLFAGDCLSSGGMSFTPAEIERIVKLANSARRQ